MERRAVAAGPGVRERRPERRGHRLARGRRQGRSRTVRDARRLLRARSAVERSGRHVCAGDQRVTAQRRAQDAVRQRADERGRARLAHTRTRRARGDARGEAERSARAVPVVAGRTAAWGLRCRRGVGSQTRRPERPEPDGLLRARDGARGAAAVPGGRGHAGAGGGRLQVARRHEPGDQSRPAAAAPRLRLSGARRLRQGHRRLRRRAPSRAERCVDYRVPRAGAPVGQEIRVGARPRAQGARAEHGRSAVRAPRSAGAPPDREGRRSRVAAAGLRPPAARQARVLRGARPDLPRHQARRATQ